VLHVPNVCAPTAWEANRKHCSICNKKIGKRVLNPRHHCRICGRCICASCSRSSLQLEGKQHRVCNICINGSVAGPACHREAFTMMSAMVSASAPATESEGIHGSKTVPKLSLLKLSTPSKSTAKGKCSSTEVFDLTSMDLDEEEAAFFPDLEAAHLDKDAVDSFPEHLSEASTYDPTSPRATLDPTTPRHFLDLTSPRTSLDPATPRTCLDLTSPRTTLSFDEEFMCQTRAKSQISTADVAVQCNMHPPATSVFQACGTWEPNVSECQLCTKRFSLRRWKHHCRLCGRCVCGDCSPHRVEISEYPDPGPQRVCHDCVVRGIH